jgi:cation/acetate symporter
MITGTVASLVLIYFSPTIQVGLLGAAAAPFPLRNPGLVSMPLAFAVAVIVALASPEPEAEARFEEVAHRAILGDA